MFHKSWGAILSYADKVGRMTFKYIVIRCDFCVAPSRPPSSYGPEYCRFVHARTVAHLIWLARSNLLKPHHLDSIGRVSQFIKSKPHSHIVNCKMH